MFAFKTHTPRWIIFIIDLLICAGAVVLAFLLRFNFYIPPNVQAIMPKTIAYVLLIRALSFYLSKTYQGIIQYTNTKDAQRIFTVVSLGSIFFVITNLITNATLEYYLIPFSIIIIDYMATVFLMISMRTITKVILYDYLSPNKIKTNVIIYGAGESGITTKQTLEKDAGTRYNVIAFIDNDANKIGKKIENVSIYDPIFLEELLKENNIAHVIISIQTISALEKESLVDLCLKYNAKVLNVPPIQKWINGQLSFKQIKKINIEELLERDPINLDNEKIEKQLNNKTILVTGAAGSIGSELVRQIIKHNPSLVILLDQAESPLFDLENELADYKSKVKIEVVIGDIRNRNRMENLFQTFKPQIVFHAAAYKHVPMMENNPSEAVLTNVLGTKTIADLSTQYHVNEFVMVSTDKAVNPTNVMGASKRIAEIYIQALGKNTKTKFVTTRFGNVLGSNGSVIPLFKKQIEKGGPITITHPDITRFFMTIPEACQLVLEAGAMSLGGEIFIFNMGKSVKIIDLAKKMIRLSGLILDKDIKIVYTGLRPGEKLFEELLNDKENTLATHHDQILIAKVQQYDFSIISNKIEDLINLFELQKNFDLVAKMKEIVPEYKSNNSIYETLDTKK